MKTGPLPVTTGPIASLFAWAEATPDAPALIGSSGTVRYAALLRGVRSQAAWLHQVGVRAGDTVAFSTEFAPRHYVGQVELFYAIAYLGAAILPLYPDVPLAARRQLIERFQAQWLVSGSPQEQAGAARRIDPRGFAATAGQWSEQAAPRGDHPGQPFLYEFTSGTTGAPKVVLITGAQFAAKILVTAGLFGWRADDVMVPPLRWPGKVGMKGLVRAHIVGAAYADAPFPETRRELVRLVVEVGVTYVGGSPWQLRRLLASEHPQGLGLAPLRLLGTAGAAMDPAEIRAARETLAANFHVGYGTTEIGLMAHLGPDDAADAALRLVPGMEAEAIDERGRPLPPGQAGRLRFRAQWTPQAYAGNAIATAESFSEGWFVSSDWGSVSADGRIALAGRVDDAINFGGSKVLPSEVEPELLAHPAIADTALVGVPHAMAGAIPVAFAVLRHAVALEEIRAFLASRLDQWQVPVEFVAVREIPRNPEGKILRERLREMYLAARQNGNPQS